MRSRGTELRRTDASPGPIVRAVAEPERPAGSSGIAGPLLLAGLLALAAGLLLMLAQRQTEPQPRLSGPEQYAYETVQASNGVLLHVVSVRPDNVTLKAISANVTLTAYFGVNGGFFYNGDILSMAVVNGQPVSGAYGDYGSGTVNAVLARGTLVWDGAADSLSVQVVRKPDELRLADPGRYWAQGGISMSPGDEEGWRAKALAERLPYPDEERLRTGAVYDDENRLYLVVGATRATAASFRAAVLEQVGHGRLADGIFLDGDGSSQMRVREVRLSGDNRPVYEMLALLH